MPLRTIKVIIQHVVGHYGDDVYELLSAAFDDPSATIVYPYVFRILNAGSRGSALPVRNSNNPPAAIREPQVRALSPASSRPRSPVESVVSGRSQNDFPSRRTASHRTSPSGSSVNGQHGPYSPTEEPDPEAHLMAIIGHISSETTGALHKEGITELHQFLKAYPHKRPRVDRLLESTGPAFRKYITRALASRAAEDQERDVVINHALPSSAPTAPRERGSSHSASTPRSPHSTSRERAASGSAEPGPQQERLSRLHNIFQYRSSTLSTSSSVHRRSHDYGSG